MPDSILDGLVEGFLDALAEREKVAPRWCAVAYSSWSGANGCAWNYRRQRDAKKAALRFCRAPQAQILVSGADITIAVARGPHNAIAYQCAHLSMLTQGKHSVIP